MVEMLDENRVRQLVEESDDARRVELVTQFVMNMRLGERNRVVSLLRGLGSDSHVGERVATARRQVLEIMEHEAKMHPDVERGPEQFGIIEMNNAQSVDNARELGWPFGAEQIDLDGELSAQKNDQSRIYFLVDGDVELTVGDDSPVTMTINSQAAIPAGTDFKFNGKGRLFALHMDAKGMQYLQPELVVGNFDDVPVGQSQTEPYHAETAQCPCGPSRRIQLIKHGWGLSTHLTSMGTHVNEEVHPIEKGHQHFTTLEAYYIARINDGEPIMTINGMSFPLSQGQLILVPRGVMHDIEGGKVDVRILVMGGHDDDDFRRANWRHVTDK